VTTVIKPADHEPLMVRTEGGHLHVRTVDGEDREARVWDDGAWECPFCTGVNVPGSSLYDERPWPYPCGNPACMAGGKGDPESVAAIREARAAQNAQEVSKARLAELDAQTREQRERERQGRADAFAAEAAEHGYCVPCWSKSTDWGRYQGQAKVVRHRKPANCPIAQRDARRLS
jgi:hypothetical protein